jgi:hypothetical protein
MISEESHAENPGPQSLKEILYAELCTQFTGLLGVEGGLSSESKSALVTLLGQPTAGASEILASLKLSDPETEEVRGE